MTRVRETIPTLPNKGEPSPALIAQRWALIGRPDNALAIVHAARNAATLRHQSTDDVAAELTLILVAAKDGTRPARLVARMVEVDDKPREGIATTLRDIARDITRKETRRINRERPTDSATFTNAANGVTTGYQSAATVRDAAMDADGMWNWTDRDDARRYAHLDARKSAAITAHQSGQDAVKAWSAVHVRDWKPVNEQTIGGRGHDAKGVIRLVKEQSLETMLSNAMRPDTHQYAGDDSDTAIARRAFKSALAGASLIYVAGDHAAHQRAAITRMRHAETVGFARWALVASNVFAIARPGDFPLMVAIANRATLATLLYAATSASNPAPRKSRAKPPAIGAALSADGLGDGISAIGPHGALKASDREGGPIGIERPAATVDETALSPMFGPGEMTKVEPVIDWSGLLTVLGQNPRTRAARDALVAGVKATVRDCGGRGGPADSTPVTAIARTADGSPVTHTVGAMTADRWVSPRTSRPTPALVADDRRAVAALTVASLATGMRSFSNAIARNARPVRHDRQSAAILVRPNDPGMCGPWRTLDLDFDAWSPDAMRRAAMRRADRLADHRVARCTAIARPVEVVEVVEVEGVEVVARPTPARRNVAGPARTGVVVEGDQRAAILARLTDDAIARTAREMAMRDQ